MITPPPPPHMNDEEYSGPCFSGTDSDRAMSVGCAFFLIAVILIGIAIASLVRYFP